VGRADTIHSADQSYNSKCGNPNWGRPIQHTPYVAIASEEQVRKLGLNEETCATSEELRHWCKHNKDRHPSIPYSRPMDVEQLVRLEIRNSCQSIPNVDSRSPPISNRLSKRLHIYCKFHCKFGPPESVPAHLRAPSVVLYC
jgi:hypothetical protein